jgi:hypothetical protein
VAGRQIEGFVPGAIGVDAKSVQGLFRDNWPFSAIFHRLSSKVVQVHKTVVSSP